MAEYWDVYNGSREKTGRRHRRGVPLKNGEYHIVVDIITINLDGRLLIDRRSPLKRNCPNYWEFTSGSVVEGEDSLDGAVRELSEEVGIVAKKDELRFIGSSRVENRFVDTYILVADVNVSNLVLQKSEVAEAKLVSLEELDKICASSKNWCRSAVANYRSEIEQTIRALA